jgi:hypothetical protein
VGAHLEDEAVTKLRRKVRDDPAGALGSYEALDADEDDDEDEDNFDEEKDTRHKRVLVGKDGAVCSECGELIGRQDKYCSSCGAKQ